jgi:hypothetical protein
MHMRNARSPLLVVALLVTLTAAFTGCGRDADRDGTDVRITDVTLGRSVDANNRVTDRTTDFNPRDTIYAAVETDATAGRTLAARWTFEDGQVLDETSRSVSAGETVTTFHVSNPAGWPPGRYRVEILVDGAVARTEEFSVR